MKQGIRRSRRFKLKKEFSLKIKIIIGIVLASMLWLKSPTSTQAPNQFIQLRLDSDDDAQDSGDITTIEVKRIPSDILIVCLEI